MPKKLRCVQPHNNTVVQHTFASTMQLHKIRANERTHARTHAPGVTSLAVLTSTPWIGAPSKVVPIVTRRATVPNSSTSPTIHASLRSHVAYLGGMRMRDQSAMSRWPPHRRCKVQRCKAGQWPMWPRAARLDRCIRTHVSSQTAMAFPHDAVVLMLASRCPRPRLASCASATARTSAMANVHVSPPAAPSEDTLSRAVSDAQRSMRRPTPAGPFQRSNEEGDAVTAAVTSAVTAASCAMLTCSECV
jgi:hypothetical protein